jgi:hypothetical protein
MAATSAPTAAKNFTGGTSERRVVHPIIAEFRSSLSPQIWGDRATRYSNQPMSWAYATAAARPEQPIFAHADLRWLSTV